MGPWEVISRGPGAVVGTVKVMKALPTEAQAGKVIAVCQTLTGWEDIPLGIVAVLLPAECSVDVLSHVAIRARNQQVILASCDDDSMLGDLRRYDGMPLKTEINATGDVTWSRPSAADAAKMNSPDAKASPPSIKMAAAPPAPKTKALSMSSFVANSKSLGGKSLNLAKLMPKLSTDYDLPKSVTIPFGVFEESLANPENEAVVEDLADLLDEERWADARKVIIDELNIPTEVSTALARELSNAGAPLPSSVPWERALKAVWASKWTERAVSSRKSMGVKDSALFLAVLVQPLRGGRYAFVIHTKSPLVGASQDEALVELCVGLGESLVSNSPGRPLSASVSSRGVSAIHSYPSKPDGVFVPDGGSLMFRSDSNGEDLEGFAGAGLYDSVAAVECPHKSVDYTSEPLVFDAAFRQKMLLQLYEVGRRVEANFGGQPQDIEGAVDDMGRITVTQSRPQV